MVSTVKVTYSVVKQQQEREKAVSFSIQIAAPIVAAENGFVNRRGRTLGRD
jgi:hypothetical protein